MISGAGKHFTAGLDLKESLSWGQQLAEIEDPARKGKFFDKMIKEYQVCYHQVTTIILLPSSNNVNNSYHLDDPTENSYIFTVDIKIVTIFPRIEPYHLWNFD